MFRRAGSRIVNTVRRGPVTSMVVVGLLGAVLAATAIAATGQSGGPITAVKVVRSSASELTTSSTFVDVPGASTTITVPSGQRALILARFSATSLCFDPDVNLTECFVRILIGGVEGAPNHEGADVFDEAPGPASGRSLQQSHAMERSRGGLGGLPAGTYEVKVQYAKEQLGAHPGSFDLNGWHLTAERSQVG